MGAHSNSPESGWPSELRDKVKGKTTTEALILVRDAVETMARIQNAYFNGFNRLLNESQRRVVVHLALLDFGVTYLPLLSVEASEALRAISQMWTDSQEREVEVFNDISEFVKKELDPKVA